MDPTMRLEGFLLKRGKVARGWKKRWFQLGDRDFSRLYYSEEKNSEKLGYIDLKVSDVRTSKADSFVIEVCNADRTFQLQAANEVQFQSWYEFLRRCTREASSNTEPLQQEIKRLLRVIHELSEERRLALELTNRLNEELARVTSTLHEQLSAANTRIGALEHENAQLRRAQGLEVSAVSMPISAVPENATAPLTNHSAVKPSPVRPVRAVNTNNSFRASMRKSLRRTLEVKRDEMRMASKQRLLDIESEVELLLEELNLLHDIDGDDAELSDSEDGDEQRGDETENNTNTHVTDTSANDTHTSDSTNDNTTNNTAASDERKLKKSTSEINMKELKHRVQSSSHQTAAIVDSLHERAATVVQQAQADASEHKSANKSEDKGADTQPTHDTTDTQSAVNTNDSAATEHSADDRPRSLDHVSSRATDTSDSHDSTASSGESSTGHKSLAEPFRPRIDSQAPGKEYVAARIKSARTQWLTRDSLINNNNQPPVHKAKVPLKRIDTAPSGHSFVRGVPRANTKTPAIALNSPRGVNQPVTNVTMLEDNAVIMCPADTIKTRLQFQGTLQHVKHYNNFFHAFRVIVRDEGFRGFTRGLPARLTYVTPAAGVSFLCYEKLISALKKPKDEQRLWLDKVLPFVGIASARVLGTSLRTPFDIVKQRMQVQDSMQNVAKYRNSVVAASAIVKQFGYRTLGQSIFVALCRDAPFAAVYFFTYEVAKRTQSDLIGRDKMGLANHLLAGAAAGASGALVTAPMDVVKTRLQTEVSLPREQRRYKGPINALRTIARDEGMRGLYRGLGARLLYLTPSAALVWGFYESFKRGFLYINNTNSAVNTKS